MAQMFRTEDVMLRTSWCFYSSATAQRSLDSSGWILFVSFPVCQHEEPLPPGLSVSLRPLSVRPSACHPHVLACRLSLSLALCQQTTDIPEVTPSVDMLQVVAQVKHTPVPGRSLVHMTPGRPPLLFMSRLHTQSEAFRRSSITE